MTSLIVAPVVTTSSTTTTPAPGGAPATVRMDPARPARRAAPDLPDWERAPSARRTQSTALARRHAPREASAEATPAARGAVTGRERSLLLHDDGAGTTQISSQVGGLPLSVEAPGQRGAQALAAFGQEGAQIAPRRVLRRQDQAAQRTLVGAERAQVDAVRRARGLQDAPDALPPGQRPALRAHAHVPRPAARARGGQRDVGTATGERAQEPAERRHDYPA